MSIPPVFARTGFAMVLIALASSPPALALNPALDVSQYVHTAWRTREGFPKDITAIAQAPDGYLWLGTEFGLFRFDGVRAVRWEPPGNQHLPSNQINSLLAARDGTLWIATSAGLASSKGGTLTTYPEFNDVYLKGLLEDRDGVVWAIEHVPRVRLCSIENGRVLCEPVEADPGLDVVGLYEDREGRLWVGTQNGFWRWKPGDRRFFSVPGQPNGVRGLVEDDDGTLLVPTRGSLRHWTTEGQELPPIPAPAGVRGFQSTRVLRDRDGGVWIGTQGGGLAHMHQGRIDTFGSAEGLSGDAQILFLVEDREGNIWVVTTEGLDRFRDPVVSTLSARQGLSTDFVTSMVGAIDGSVWIGSIEGLNRWLDGRNTIYRKRSAPAAVPPPHADNVLEINGPGLPQHSVQSIGEDHRGRMWVSTPDGLSMLDHGQWTPIRGIPAGDFRVVVEDSEATIWVAQFPEGLYRVRSNDVARRVPLTEMGHDDTVTAIAADRRERGIWLGFARGGVAYMSDGRIREWYAAAEGLAKGRVNALYVDRTGTVWVATNNGLSQVREHRVRTLTTSNGLPCNAINWAIEDDDHSFWILTECGLARVPAAELEAGGPVHATMFDASDGVSVHKDSFRYMPHVSKARDGRIWFLTTSGAGVIDPRRIPFNTLPPPVTIEQLRADRATYDPTAAAKGLPARTHDLELDYTALSLVASEKNQFRYKLEGYDRDWHAAGTRRQAFYTNLPPRTYRFRVIASNNSGLWNETGATLDFSIAPAYYQTMWFRIAIALGAIALLWAAYQYRLRQVAAAFDARLQERVNERTRIARDLHDTLLQSFHGLLFRFQAVSNRMPAGATKQQLDDVIDQTAQAITEGRDAVQNLRASTTVTNDLAEALGVLADELKTADRADAGSRPIVDIAVEGASRELHPVVRDDVYRIVGEALRNAYRHASARHIEVRIRYDDAQLQVRVRDDGCGIDPEARDAGRPGHFGLPGMRERAELIGGRLDVWSEATLGTEIELTIRAAAAYTTSRPRWAGHGLVKRFVGRRTNE